MLRSRFIACADIALRDVETQQVSLINLLEEIAAPGFPLVLPRLSVYARFERERTDPDRFPCVLVLVVDRITVGTCRFELAFATVLASHALIHVTDIVIPTTGVLRAIVQHNSETVTGIEIPIRKV